MGKKWLAAAFLAMLFGSGCVLHAQDSQQQVQSAFPTKKVKATGTPQQAIPTQVASDAIPEEDQATAEQIDELMDVMRVEDQLEDMISLVPMVLEQQQKNLMQSYEPQMARLNSAQKEQVEKLKKKYMDKADEIYPAEDMAKDVAKLYQKHLNNDDVEALINFYNTDAGQHLLDAQPEVMKVFLPAMTAELEKRLEAQKAAEKKDLDALLASFHSGAGRK